MIDQRFFCPDGQSHSFEKGDECVYCGASQSALSSNGKKISIKEMKKDLRSFSRKFINSEYQLFVSDLVKMFNEEKKFGFWCGFIKKHGGLPNAYRCVSEMKQDGIISPGLFIWKMKHPVDKSVLTLQQSVQE